MSLKGNYLLSPPPNSSTHPPFYADESFIESLSLWASPNDELQLTVENFVLTAVYSAIFLTGVFGNFVTAYVVLKKPHMKTITNRLIFNLALSDSFFMLCLPFVVVTSIERSWVFGGLMCKAFYAINCVNIFAGSFTLAILSADRYIAVCHSVYAIKHRSPARAMIAIMLSWLLSCIATLPAIWYAVVVDRDSIEVDDEEYEDEDVLRDQSYPYPSYDRYNQSYYFSYFEGIPYPEQVFSYQFQDYVDISRVEEDYRLRNSTQKQQIHGSSPNRDLPTYYNLDQGSWSNLTNPYFSKHKSLTCSVNFPTHEAYPLKFAYVIYSAVVGFILPVITIIVFYTLLVMRLASTTNKVNQKPEHDVIVLRNAKKDASPKTVLHSSNPSCLGVKGQISKQRKALFSLKSISSPDIPAVVLAFQSSGHHEPGGRVDDCFLPFVNRSPVRRTLDRIDEKPSGAFSTFHDKVLIQRVFKSRSAEEASIFNSSPTLLNDDVVSKLHTNYLISICNTKHFGGLAENLEVQSSEKGATSSMGGSDQVPCYRNDSRTPTNNPTVSSVEKNSTGPGSAGAQNEAGDNSKCSTKGKRGPRKKNRLVTANSGRRHRKVTRLVTAVIIVYVACWLPYYAFQVITPFLLRFQS